MPIVAAIPRFIDRLEIDPRFYVQSSQVRGEKRAYWIEDRHQGTFSYRHCVQDFGTRKRAAEKECARLNAECAVSSKPEDR